MYFIIFILGLFFGSFFLLISTRIPRGEDVIFKRSYCEECKNILNWYNLVPIFSFVFQRGKCSKCKSKISILYPIIELITALSFTYIYHISNTSYDLFVGLILISLLINICITDFKHLLILDQPLIFSILVISLLQIYYHGVEFFLEKFLAGVILFLFMLGIKKLGDILYKRESLGGGDIKFAFLIGLSVGFTNALMVLILSALLALPTSVGTVLITKNKEVPYGPFLAGALLIVFINLDKFNDLINYIIA